MKYDKYKISRFCWMHSEESAAKVVSMAHSARDYVVSRKFYVERDLRYRDRYYIEKRGVYPQDFELIRAILTGIALALGIKMEW